MPKSNAQRVMYKMRYETGHGISDFYRPRHLSLSAFSLLLLLAVLAMSLSLHSQPARRDSNGLVWQVRGEWRLNGKGAVVRGGDPVQPGALLQPGNDSSAHSIVILLPDSQRVFYECFTATDCARSFRVPPLYRTPDPFAVDMVGRVQAVLAVERPDSSPVSKAERDVRMPQDEVAAVLGADNRIQLGGLASALPDGEYTCDLTSLDGTHPPQFHIPVDKRDGVITVALPSAGLYTLKITDALNTPRINLFVAALRPEQATAIIASFHKASVLIKAWNGDAAGWPTHPFRRAYLESLVKGIKPQSPMFHSAEVSRVSAVAKAGGPGVTATDQAETAREPSFSPKPGEFSKGIEVTLQSNTDGATIHYTTNDSQPLDSSPVYRAPIIVKGSVLIIKAYASSPGKKDSPVVTGIFRIEE